MKFGIVSGGPDNLLPDIKKYKVDYWIGADFGAITIIEKQLPLYLAIGDFDSIDECQLEIVKANAKMVQTLPAQKDETDTEVAINKAIQLGATEILLFGATGGRFDHTFANIWLLIQLKNKYPAIHIHIVDKNNKIELLLPGTYLLENEKKYKYISFYSVGINVENLNLKDFKYPLHNYLLPIGSILCSSNEFVKDNGNVSFSNGILLVVRSHD